MILAKNHLHQNNARENRVKRMERLYKKTFNLNARQLHDRPWRASSP
jgi:hypothetical protein